MSDNDSGGEVREKLRKASIEPSFAASRAAENTSSTSASRLGAKHDKPNLSDVSSGSSDEDQETGNQRKRSRSVDDEEDEDASGTRAKKRVSSSSSSVDGRRVTPSKAAHMQALASPKGKRTRDEFLRDNGSEDDDDKAPDSPKKANEDTNSDEERTVKRKREASLAPDASKTGDAIKSPVKLAPSSGFANASAASPFASLSSPAKKETKPEAVTSKSAFEASSFGKLAQSKSSPFGSIDNSSSASPFGGFSSTASASGFASASGNPIRFGGLGVGAYAIAESVSPWAAATSKPSVFSSGSALGKAPPPITGLSSAPAKPFGAPADPEEEEEDYEGSEDEGSENDGDDENEEDSAPIVHEKLVKVPNKSGEEDEFTVFTSRAKLYQFAGEWKECGTGTLKLNVSRLEDDPYDVGLETLFHEMNSDDEEEDLIVRPGNKSNGAKKDDEEEKKNKPEGPHRKARFILRVDGSGRLVLNSALSSKMLFGGDEKGSEPTGQRLLFHGTLATGEGTSGDPVKLTLKMKQDKALELWSAVEVVKKVL